MARRGSGVLRNGTKLIVLQNRKRLGMLTYSGQMLGRELVGAPDGKRRQLVVSMGRGWIMFAIS